jgi:hypothetical protein
VTNLKPERFSRRAKHKRRQTPNKSDEDGVIAKMHVRLDNEQTHNNGVWGDEEAVTDDV